MSAARLELYGGVLVRARGHDLLALAGTLDLDLALEHHASGELNLALDRQLLAELERGHPVGDHGVHGVHELVAVVELDQGWHPSSFGRELDAEILCDNVGVGPQRQQVVALLHWRESRPRDADRFSAFETGDGCAHCGLELDYLRGLLVARVHSLVVQHHRQWNRAASRLEERLQLHQVHPQVVGVEIRVLRRVLESFLILLRTLRRLAQRKTTVGLLSGEVATLLVGIGAVSDLHHERGAGALEVGQQLKVHRRAQVVGVRHEHVLQPLGQELVQGATAEHRGVEVTMPGRAPLVVWGRGPGRWRVAVLGDLGGLVLHEGQVGASAEIWVPCQCGLGVGLRGERVHQHELHVRLAVSLLHPCHLLGYEVEEAVPLVDSEQGLRLIQPHASTESAVQLQDEGFLQQLRLQGHVQRLVPRQRRHWVQRGLWHHGGLARAQHFEIVLERVDGGFVATVRLHFRLVGRPQGLK
mmetsp:Transcript_123239/g.334697  ORF Transcript_123239/g.334697 Transcript_123239/m.334697 type:complete len:471 (+) Transcript_123239:200-1612(+)